jgi:hypothetical protein
MRYTVVWEAAAEVSLTTLWTDATDRNAVTAAANAIDQDLSTDPEWKGESRTDNVRVMFVSPLGVL